MEGFGLGSDRVGYAAAKAEEEAARVAAEEGADSDAAKAAREEADAAASKAEPFASWTAPGEAAAESELGLSYKGTQIDRVRNGVFVGGGTIPGVCHVRDFIPDETHAVRFTDEGVVGLLNHGKDRNFSEFFITTRRNCSFMDGYHVGFGRVVGEDALETLRKLDQLYHIKGKPVSPVTVAECGVCE